MHGALGGGVICLPLSFFYLSPVGCLARLSGWRHVLEQERRARHGTPAWRALPGRHREKPRSETKRSQMNAWQVGDNGKQMNGDKGRQMNPSSQTQMNPSRPPSFSLVASKPGCLARLCGWTDSFVSLCLPLFVPGCHGFMRVCF